MTHILNIARTSYLCGADGHPGDHTLPQRRAEVYASAGVLGREVECVACCEAVRERYTVPLDYAAYHAEPRP